MTPDPTGPRNPHLKPVKDARNKPLVAHVDLTQPHLEGEHPQLADAPGMYPPPDHPHGAAMGQPPGYMDPHYMGAPPGQPGYPMDPMQGGMPPPGYPMQQGMPMQPGLGPPMHPDMHGGIPPPGYVPGGGPPGGYMPMDAMHGHMPGGPPHGAYMGPGPGYQPGPHTGPPM
uniref:Uncharacterized protein n=1 Tax=Chlamydomonas leiostraca TaxID=1034604 RepID=A0A7S0WTA0_9CHLO